MLRGLYWGVQIIVEARKATTPLILLTLIFVILLLKYSDNVDAQPTGREGGMTTGWRSEFTTRPRRRASSSTSPSCQPCVGFVTYQWALLPYDVHGDNTLYHLDDPFSCELQTRCLRYDLACSAFLLIAKWPLKIWRAIFSLGGTNSNSVRVTDFCSCTLRLLVVHLDGPLLMTDDR